MWEFHLYGENIRHLQSLNSDGDDKFNWKNFCGTYFNGDYHYFLLLNIDARTHNIASTSSSFHNLNLGILLSTHTAFDDRKILLLWALLKWLVEEM